MPAIKSVQTALSLIQSDKSKVLGLTVGPHNSVPPGQEIPKADAQSIPELSFASASPSTTYVVICLDIDAPFPSFGFLSPILHWIQPGLKLSETGSETGGLTSSDTPFVVNFIGPAPPPGSSSHRYVFLLYEQPADFDGKKYAPADGAKMSNWQRMRYDFGAFEKKVGLGPVLAANYFKSK